MRRVWPFLILAFALAAGACTSSETVPLSSDDIAVPDLKVPVPVPRATAAAKLVPSAPVAAPDATVADPPLPPYPVARPPTGSVSLEPQRRPSAGAAAVAAEVLRQVGAFAIGTAHAAEAKPVRTISFEEASFSPHEAATPAAAPTKALLDPEAVERRSVKAIEGCVNDVFRTCPRTVPTAASAQTASLTGPDAEEIASATLGFISAASTNMRTVLWVLIGFAALLGLFISARRSAD